MTSSPQAPRDAIAPSDDEIAREIMLQCMERGADKSICPSEVARALAPSEAAWRPLMLDVRRVAQRLADEGRIKVTQRGTPTSALSARGPVRLSLCVNPDAVKTALRKMRRS